jgi:hypothetical protein
MGIYFREGLWMNWNECDYQIYNFNEQQVILWRFSYAFAFPKPISSAFKLLGGTTVGYLADSIFYRLDLTSGKAEALQYRMSYEVIQRVVPFRRLRRCRNEAWPYWLITANHPTSVSTSQIRHVIFKLKTFARSKSSVSNFPWTASTLPWHVGRHPCGLLWWMWRRKRLLGVVAAS